KAGAAFLPLDPTTPPAQLSFMLQDAQVAVLLTHTALDDPRSSIVDRGQSDTDIGYRLSAIVYLDADWPSITHHPTDPPDSAARPDNLAYLIYTSGSTGMPKGVAVEHRGLLNLVFWHQRAFAISAHDRASQVAAPAFDAAVWEVWPYLALGASLHIVADE